MKGYTMPFLWIANNDYEAIGREIEKFARAVRKPFASNRVPIPIFAARGGGR